MSSGSILLIAISVLLSVSAQFFLKLGMSSEGVKTALATGSLPQAVMTVALSPFVIGGLIVYFLSAAVWLMVLSRVALSQAYPFVGLGFVLTMIVAIVGLGENVNVLRAAGTLLIAGGAVLVARS